MSTPGQSNQYRGEGFVVYFEGSENDKAWYETKGNSSEMETPNARPFFTSEGAMIPHARIAPPTNKTRRRSQPQKIGMMIPRDVQKLQLALRPLSMPAPKKAGVTREAS